MKRTKQEMPTQNRTNSPASAETPAKVDAPTETPANEPEAAKQPEAPQVVQLTAVEAEMLKDAETLKSDADAVRHNVDMAREVSTRLNPVIGPFTAACRNLGIMDGMDKLGGPDTPAGSAVSATQAAMDTLGIGVSVTTALEMVQMIASNLQSPDLSILDNADMNAIAASMGEALKNTRYVQVSDMVRTTAQAALQHHQASRSALREWVNKSGRAVPSATGTQGPKAGSNGTQGPKQTEKVSDLIGTDIVYHCDNCGDVGYKGGTTLSGVYYAIRDHYCTCRNEPQSAHAGSSPTYQGIKAGVNNVVTGANQDTVPGGYVVRANAA